MTGLLYGLSSDRLIETWHGTLEELSDRYHYEGHGYYLDVLDDSGECVAELRHD